MLGRRRRAREAALRILYMMDVGRLRPEEALEGYWQWWADARERRDEELRRFADALVQGYVREAGRIDQLIGEASHHWRLERMNRVDRNILRLGTSELITMTEVPRRVTLNEAVELAKRYGAEGSASFVNGVLDRIASQLGRS